MSRLAAAAVLLALGLAVPTAQAGLRMRAEATPSERRPVGRIVFGVSLENDASPERGRLVVEQLEISGGRRVELPLSLAPLARKRLLVTFDTRPGSQDFECRFVTETGVLAQVPVRVPSAGTGGPLIAALGPVPGWLRGKDLGGTRAVELDPKLLPADAGSWPDVDAIVWPDPRVGDLELETAAALRAWVRGGGQLLTGTAADQSRALEELGFESWPAFSAKPEAVGFGSAARSELDLARNPPAETLRPSGLVQPPDQMNWWLATESPFETMANSIMSSGNETPRAPVWGVGLVLGAYLLLSGPGEWWSHRRAAKLGKRPAFAALRRPAMLIIATGAVLALAGGLAEDQLEMVRIDVIDVDLSSEEVRARAFAVVRRRSGGWVEVEATAGSSLSAGLGSRTAGSGHRHGGYEPERVFSASSGPRAGQRSARSHAAQWASVSWRLAYEPDADRVEAVRQRVRREIERPLTRLTRPKRLDPSLPLHEQVEVFSQAMRSAQHCWNRSGGLDSLLDCAESSCDAFHGLLARRRGMRRPDMEWPAGGSAWVSVEEGGQGPELLVDGEKATGRRFTVWRVLLPEEAS